GAGRGRHQEHPGIVRRSSRETQNGAERRDPDREAGMAVAVTVIMRQAGFAIGIATLGAVLGLSGGAPDYARMFLVAASACAVASVAALLLLPSATVARIGGEKQQQAA
ncbi:MAG: hypothetical protein ACK5AT_33750, partial [Bradyrhizobium sp.]